MTRVMKRQLEEELDINKPPTIKPPPVTREPSFKSDTQDEDASDEESEYTLPRDDDEFSPAHGEDDPGTGVDDEPEYTEEDVAAAEAERDAVEEAAAADPEDEAVEKKEAS